MPRMISLIVMGVAVAALVGCSSVPRGAALSSEILQAQQADHAAFQVVSVKRDSLDALAQWPATGWSGQYTWIDGTRGPQSPLIRSGDKVSLVIWDSQENSLLTPGASKQAVLPAMVVSAKGTVFVPYLGEVALRNLTPDAARAKVQKAMEPIVPSAQVQLSVEAGQRNSVALVGGVARPGSYPLPDRNHSVLSLIADGGGVQSSLRNPVVRLIRSGKAYEIRAERLLADPALNIALRGDDKIVVEEDKRYFTALGATGREELVPFERETVTAMEALSMIGGLSDSRANLNSVLVLRDYPKTAVRADASAELSGPSQEQVIFTFDLTSAEGLFAARKFQINPKDTVFGTEAVITSARTVLGLVGSLVGVSTAVSNVTN